MFKKYIVFMMLTLISVIPGTSQATNYAFPLIFCDPVDIGDGDSLTVAVLRDSATKIKNGEMKGVAILRTTGSDLPEDIAAFDFAAVPGVIQGADKPLSSFVSKKGDMRVSLTTGPSSVLKVEILEDGKWETLYDGGASCKRVPQPEAIGAHN